MPVCIYDTCMNNDIDKIKIIIIGSGIGRVMAQEFAKLGAKVIMWDINTKCNEMTQEMVRKQGGTSYTYTVDVR